MMNKELIVTALRFRAYALFKHLDDSQIFAVGLSDGTIGYCCVMGNGGEYYSLALYRGDKGFSTYLSTIDTCATSAMERFETQCRNHSINCAFENAGDCLINQKEREYIRKVAKEEGIKMCRSKAWPDFFVVDGPTRIVGIEDERDSGDMMTALDAGCEVARRIKGLGMAELRDLGLDNYYASQNGGKKIPLLTKLSDGTWSWDCTITPARYEEEEYVAPEYDEPEIITRIKAMRHCGILQCRLAHSPVAIGDGRKSTVPMMLLAVTRPEGMMPFIPPIVEENEDCEFDILDKFAESVVSTGICPKGIETDDLRTFYCLYDFCKKTGIKLNKVSAMPMIAQIWKLFYSINECL